MAEDHATLYALIAIAVVAVVGLGLSLASIAANESIGGMMGRGGGMMGNGPGGGTAVAGAGLFEWIVLALSLVVFVVVAFLLIRNRNVSAPLPGASRSATGYASAPPAAPLQGGSPPSPPPIVAAPRSVPEPTLVKLLGEDERRMYLELRDHGGEMLQRDLVALGIFSKAKVTRVLDKLESKGLVVREARGMTNRVRLTAKAPR